MTFAQFVGSSSSGIVGLLNIVVIPIIFTLAFLVFIWGVVKYLFFHGNEETQRAEGREFILWGIIGMVILFSVWSLVNIILSTLGL